MADASSEEVVVCRYASPRRLLLWMAVGRMQIDGPFIALLLLLFRILLLLGMRFLRGGRLGCRDGNLMLTHGFSSLAVIPPLQSDGSIPTNFYRDTSVTIKNIPPDR